MNEKTNDESIEFNFSDLAECNNAEDSQIIHKKRVDASEFPNLNIEYLSLYQFL